MPQLALLLSTILWAATFPAMKLGVREASPLSFLFLRMLIGALLVGFGLMVFRKSIRWDREMLRMAGIGSACMLIGNVAQMEGIAYTTASNSAFITALYAVFVPLFLRRFSPALWSALAFAVVGLWLLIKPSVELNRGDLYTVIGAIAFAWHMIALEFYRQRSESTSLLFWQLSLVTIGLAIPAQLSEHGLATVSITPTLLLTVGITGILGTGVAFFIQIWAQRHVSADRVALIFAIEPALAAWLSWVVLDEQLDVSGWIGSGLILIGILVGTFKR